MFLITSAAYVTPALISEFGKLPPCMLPVQNRRLYEHQIALSTNDQDLVLSLPFSYVETEYDKRHLKNLGVKVVKVPDNISLGQSVVYVLNVIGKYEEPLEILHGDTLFPYLPNKKDVCTVSAAEDGYEWDTAGKHNKSVYSGYFSFSNQSLLIQKITENGYKFIQGVEAYSNAVPIELIELPNWMDFGLSNSYYRSISKMTTQRVFNSMKVTRYSVIKSSKDKLKMRAEANWIKSMPTVMKHYVPAVWDEGEIDDKAYYEIEYYFLSSLANLFVFGKNKPYIWEEIINACVDFLNDEANIRPSDCKRIIEQTDRLYGEKTLLRITDFAKKTGISLDEPWYINGLKTPSVKDIIKETNDLISKKDLRFATLMHGDPCFSNILYDFKSKSIKLIDPRGVDNDGNLSIYGDFRYDVGKLAHSIIGMYDFIIGGMYDYCELENSYNVRLAFEITDDIKQIQNYFLSQKFGGFSIKELSTYPIMIHLFLSMLPLHHDNPERQKAMLANALRLYVEFKNQQ